MMVDTVRLRLSNAHLLRGDRAVLVDAGAPGDGRRIDRALRAKGWTRPRSRWSC